MSSSSLYSARFDAAFVFGTFALALSFGAIASWSAATLMAVVLVDIWLFANPHVIATYTRIAASKAHVKRHWFLVFLLPLVVLIAVTVAALAYEAEGLITFYLMTQTYHVARQSFGIARAYRRADPRGFRLDWASESLIYLVPLWGLLYRCNAEPAVFLGYSISLPPVPLLGVQVVGIFTVGAGAWWLFKLWRDFRSSRLHARHAWFVASHVCVFGLAYLWLDDLTLGWLIVNIWHNVQYLFFVWLQNVRRDQSLPVRGALAHDESPSVAAVFNPLKNAAKYMAVCLVLGAALYHLLDLAGQQLMWLGLPTVLIAHFTFNFHHYLVDGVIWKRRGSRVGTSK
jgi:hypothetical protein